MHVLAVCFAGDDLDGAAYVKCRILGTHTKVADVTAEVASTSCIAWTTAQG